MTKSHTMWCHSHAGQTPSLVLRDSTWHSEQWALLLGHQHFTPSSATGALNSHSTGLRVPERTMVILLHSGQSSECSKCDVKISTRFYSQWPWQVGFKGLVPVNGRKIQQRWSREESTSWVFPDPTGSICPVWHLSCSRSARHCNGDQST